MHNQIEKHVLNTAKHAEISIKNLAEYLTKSSKNDREKAKAIYCWITSNISYDVSAYPAGAVSRYLSPDEVLKRKSAVCQGYAELFAALGTAAGLEVKTVDGYAKGFSYSAGDVFRGDCNHAWNALKINGKWHLLDVTWGAGHVENGKFIRHYEEYYFCPPSNHFIYSHFPRDPQLQLLSAPVSLQDFEKLVYVKPAFFKNSISLRTHTAVSVKTGNQIAVTLGVPDHILLEASLVHETYAAEQMTFIQKEPEQCKIYAVFPHKGTYILRVFSRDENTPGNFDWTLDYLIEAGEGVKKNTGFPAVYSDFYEKKVYLYSPVTGYLKHGTTQHFRLWIPGAGDVAVNMDGRMVPLMKSGRFFAGDVTIRPDNRELKVFARFSNDTNYKGLLKYKCISA